MSAFDEDQPFDEDEEMPLTERDLADDAQWKIIQKNTFTRWANEHLKTINKGINDLEADLADGLRLIGLVEVLSGKKFRKVNKRPNFRTQKLENVTMVLQFLEEDEGIKIVNIDSGDIVDQKLKLILGLIWTLILHYSISMPMWEGEEPQPQEGGPTPKQRLLNWINNKVPELPIKNFTTDWNDGKAIGALVDAIAPGLCPDWEDWDPKKAKDNAKEAMDAAEKWLDVPQLIKPDEMTNPKVDDLSMMTYLSQFPQAKLKPGAPLRPKLSAGKVRAYGPGLEPKGNMMGSQAKFTVETFGAGKGNLDILVLDPKGKQVKCDSVFNKDKKMTYSCVYVPNMEGDFKVIIKYGEKEIAKSPFTVKVEGAAGDASKVTAKGPGLEKTGCIVNTKTYFEVFTKDAGKGAVDVVIMDPNGHRDKVKPTITPQKEGVYLVEYTATIMGLHSINISFAGKAIPNSPFGVNIGAAINPKAVYATGRGIQPRGVRVKQHAEFKVHTKGAGTAEVKCQVIGPGGANIKCEIKPSKTEEGVYECFYIPPKVGQYVINITFGGHHITKSPFRVDVGPEKTSKVVAYGPGLEGGVVNQPACFTVETNGETGALGFSIEGPSQAKIDCKDNGDGSADVTYWPTAPGEYAVHIMCEEEDIPQAPYMAQIQPATTEFDASKVTAKGPGLEKTGVIINKWAEFTVDARKAGKAPLHITCLDASYKPVNVEVKDKKDGTFECRYNPKNPVRHTIIITWGSVSIPKSPYRVTVSQPCVPGNVKVYGPGVEKGVKTYVKTYFKVDCTTAGPGDVGIVLVDDKGKDVPVKTTDNKDGTFTVEYEPTTPGMYTVQVYFAEKEIPKSPIKVKVESSIDVSKVTVKGLDTPIPLGETRPVYILTPKQKTKGPCKVTVTTPKKKTVELPVKDSPDGYTTSFTPTETGPHKVEVTYDKKPVDKSPFTVNVEPKKTTPKVEVRGLEKPIQVGENRPITIDTSSMPKKDSPCKVTVTSPKKKTVELPVKKSPEGYTTTLTPTETGPHKVEVTYDKKPVPDSPFPVEVVPKGAVPAADLPKGDVIVKGLETPVAPGEKRPVKIDTTNAPKKDAPCKVTNITPKKRTNDLKTKKVPEGYETSFSTWDIGVHIIKVEYDGKEIPSSPFEVVVEKIDVTKVTVKGLDTPIPLGETRKISIITKETGRYNAVCKVIVTTPKGETSEIPTELKTDGYDCMFTPKVPGKHTVKIEFAGKEVPNSPFTVHVETIDVSKVLVKGLETPIMVGENRPITINTTACGKEVPCKVLVTSPKNAVSELPTFKTADGHGTSFTPSEIGPHKVTVECAGQDVPGSPFPVMVEKKSLKPVVKGLETPIQVGEKRPIQVIAPTKKEGRFGPEPTCKVFAVNPKGKTSELPISVTTTAFETTYKPTEMGTHKVKVEYMDKEITGSPFTVDVLKSVDVSKVKVKGLETPVEVNEKRPVSIITSELGQEVPCRVTVMNPKNATEELPTSKTPEGHETTFAPTEVGPHKVKVECAGKEVPGSPFAVQVEKKILRIAVKGLETPIQVGDKRPVQIMAPTKKENRFAPEPTCKAVLTNPKGKTFELPIDKTDKAFETVLTPKDLGPHKVSIEYNGKEIPDSPYTVDVMKPVDVSKVTVSGLDSPVQVNTKRPVSVNTAPVGEDVPCIVKVTTPKNQTSELPLKKTPEGFDTTFAPTELGPHKVKVEVAGKEVPGSPFNVPVEKKVTSITTKGLDTPIQVGEKRKIEVIAPTKKEGRFGPEPSVTIVATTPKGRKAELPVAVTSTSFETTYSPHETGPHTVKVEYMGKDVPGSPFTVSCEKPMDKALAGVQVLGLDTPITVGETRPITIDTQRAGKPDAPCELTAENPKGQTVTLPTKKIPAGYETTFAPLEPGPHKIKVQYAGQEIPNSPIEVPVEPSRAALKGVEVSGLDTPVTVGEKRPIDIKTDKPDAPCKVTATNPKGKPEDLPTKKTKDGYQATFAPLEVGPYKVKVEYAGKEIPKSPFSVPVEPKIDMNKIEVKGLETPVKVGEKRPVEIVTKTCGNPEPQCTVTAINPKKESTECPLKKSKEGYETMFAPLEDGPHLVKVEVAGKEIPKSPFKVDVPKLDLNKVDIKGLEKPVEVDEIRKFVVETQAVSDFEIPCKVTASTPMGKTMFLPAKKVPEGYECTFAPKEEGPHKVKVEYAGHEVPKSPVNVKVEPKLDLKKLKVEGLEKPIQLGETRPISVDTTTCGKPDEPCKLFAKGPTSPYIEIPTKKTPKGYEAQYTPTEAGPNAVKLEYAEREYSKTPFVVNVESDIDELKVLVQGLEARKFINRNVIIFGLQ